jgi:predicted lipoprotein with Yx(FWY)xxD motif
MKNLITILVSTATAVAAAVSMSASAHAAGSASPVTSVKVGNQEILADHNGMTVYTYDPDQGSTSTCYGGCATHWPPVLLPAGDSVVTPFGLTTRTDGTKQITYDNHPLYLFAGDQKPGDTTGDGLGGVWHIVPGQ